MPTDLRLAALRVAIYPNDHRPAHVHVIGNGNEAIFELGCPAGNVSLRENYGFSRQDLTRIARKLKANQSVLCKAWEGIHGSYS